MTTDPHAPRRFRVTVEGVTRYVGSAGLSADVILTMPGPFRGAGGRITRDVMLGSMSLADVEWLPEPAKVGDVIEGRAAFDALPVGAYVTNGYHGLIRTKKGFITTDGELWELGDAESPRTLVYLPDADA